MADIDQIIRKRKSCRAYLKKRIDQSVKHQLETYMQSINPGLLGESIDFKLIEKPLDDPGKMRLNYGMITNHHSYILGTSAISLMGRLNYGFLLEKIVLKATDLDLSTCWVGYFDPNYFNEIKIDADTEIPSIIIVGYPRKNSTLQERLTRMSIRASYRKAWNELFFCDDFNTPLNYEIAGKYANALEMLRLAPSSGNTQPWRILLNSKLNSFHFFKKVISSRYEEKGLHDIDLGICMAHFALIAENDTLDGEWKHLEIDEARFPDLTYIMSWVM